MKKPKVIINERDVIEYHEIDGLLHVEGLTLKEIKEAYEVMIDALIESHEAIYCWIETTDCDCDGYHICGLPKRQLQLFQITEALIKAGCTE